MEVDSGISFRSPVIVLTACVNLDRLLKNRASPEAGHHSRHSNKKKEIFGE